MKSPKIYTSLKVSSLKQRGRHMVGDLWKYLVQIAIFEASYFWGFMSVCLFSLRKLMFFSRSMSVLD